MIIKNSQVTMAAAQRHTQQRETRESLQIQTNRSPHPTNQPTTQRPPPPAASTDRVSLNQPAAPSEPVEQTLSLDQPLDAMDELRAQIILRMMKELTGHEFKLFSPEAFASETPTLTVQWTPPSLPTTASNATTWVYERVDRQYESEQLSFAAEGTIETADGRSIAFSVTLSMSRTFYSESRLAMSNSPLQKIDPLVINFSGNAAQLSSTRFRFDLDADGQPEQLATLRPGSGFLAWDRNGDGEINDGRELFGPTTGQGFAELAQHDEDGNGFIDEGDRIYQQLRIWEVLDDGTRRLSALGDKNIGAIYLGHVTSPFQLRGADNQALGEVVRSGIYLTEDGKAGTVQELNLIV